LIIWTIYQVLVPGNRIIKALNVQGLYYHRRYEKGY
jgi:hypothetical protein